MSTEKEKAERIFYKAISLMEDRLRLKIKNAVFILDTDYGEFEFVLKDKPELLILMQKFYNKRLTSLIMHKRGSQLITCDLCLGTGETTSGGMLIDCSKCKGGGEMMVHYELSPETTKTIGEIIQ